MRTLLLHSDLLAEHEQTLGLTALFSKQMVMGKDKWKERMKNKYLSLWEKKQCHVHYHRNSSSARGRKYVDQ